MAQGILLALLAAAIYGFLGLAFEMAAKRDYPKWGFMLYKQSFGTLLGLAFTLLLGLPFYRPKVALMALAGAVSYLATLWAYLTASRERDIAANWTILNLSVALPILFSVCWFHDRFTASKALGITFTLLAIILIGGFGRKRIGFTAKWARWISVAFLLNGWFVVLLRFVPEGLGALFTFYFYFLSALITIVYKLVAREARKRAKGIYGVAALGAATHWSGVMLTIVALAVVRKVSAQAGLIVYPITNGLPIVMGVVIGSLVLKQKVATRSAWGIACGSAAMIFLSWS
jgi:drug/metabolite transporter (DMT)-like permease